MINFFFFTFLFLFSFTLIIDTLDMNTYVNRVSFHHNASYLLMYSPDGTTFDTANSHLFMTYGEANDIGIVWPSANELFPSSSPLITSVAPIKSNDPTMGQKPQVNEHNCESQPSSTKSHRVSAQPAVDCQDQPYQPIYPDIRIHDDAGLLTTSIYTSPQYPSQQESSTASSVPCVNNSSIPTSWAQDAQPSLFSYPTQSNASNLNASLMHNQQHGTTVQQVRG